MLFLKLLVKSCHFILLGRVDQWILSEPLDYDMLDEMMGDIPYWNRVRLGKRLVSRSQTTRWTLFFLYPNRYAVLQFSHFLDTGNLHVHFFSRTLPEFQQDVWDYPTRSHPKAHFTVIWCLHKQYRSLSSRVLLTLGDEHTPLYDTLLCIHPKSLFMNNVVMITLTELGAVILLFVYDGRTGFRVYDSCKLRKSSLLTANHALLRPLWSLLW